MSALSEVLGALRSVLGLLADGRQALQRATESRDRAAAQLTELLHGATAPEAAQTQAALATTQDRIDTASAATAQAEQHIRAYLTAIQGEPIAAPVPDDRVDRVRTSLPRGVRGAQTTGWWLRSDGGRVRLRSGADSDPNSWEQKAKRFLRETFPGAMRPLPELSRHVEIQLAIRSHEQPFDHEVLVIDRKVCGRDDDTRDMRYTCDRYLPLVLAVEAKLTVVEHDGTRVTYVGRRVE